MTPRQIHVITNLRGGWNVHRRGAGRAARSFRTRDEAIAFARGFAIRAKSELVVHARDGLIDERVPFDAPSKADRRR